MKITRTVAETRAAVAELGTVALVPTMGALHEGHLSLMRRARALARRVVVSIFVNPTQFGPQEDLARYPRPIERDLDLCSGEDVDLVFNPAASEIYPPDELEMILEVPALTRGLEGASRPGHFIGVCRVVAKLLNIVQPDVACFGMKDYQQLCVVRAMVRGLCMPVRIEACPTIREPDGRAMSSRNIFLTSEQRADALGLSRALGEARSLIAQGRTDPAGIETAMLRIMKQHRFEVDYAVVRSAGTLLEVDRIDVAGEPVVCLVAGKLGDVRLIDNAVVGQ
jgi:pantoate--beta-alanine ligase